MPFTSSEWQPGATAVAREGTRVQGIGEFFGTLFGPIGTVFHFVFYLPVYNILMIYLWGCQFILPGWRICR